MASGNSFVCRILSCLGLVLLLSACGVVGGTQTKQAAPASLEASLAPGAGAVLRHVSGAQLKILPGTFAGDTHVRIAEESVVPLANLLAAPVWSLEADSNQFSKPIELVLPASPDAETSDDLFGVYWDGHHWARVPGVVMPGGTSVRVEATHFSLWSVGRDPCTFTSNAETVPALLAIDVPEGAKPLQEVSVDYAVANLGRSDLKGYGIVSARVKGTSAPPAESARIVNADGSDGPFGSTVYATSAKVAAEVATATLVDDSSLQPLTVKMPGSGDAQVEVRLTFYDEQGRPVNSVVQERLVRSLDQPTKGEQPLSQSTALPERIEMVRPMGPPLVLQGDGTAQEGFDAADAFTGNSGRDVARGWGAYQAGVAALFGADRTGGLEGSVAQMLEARGASRVGILRQVAGLTSGETYRFAVSYRLAQGSSGAGAAKVRFGVDLNGGDDPLASQVIWSEGSIAGEWASLELPELVATSDRVTVFLELQDSSDGIGAVARFDQLEIQAKQALSAPDLLVQSISLDQPGGPGCSNASAVLRVEIKNAGGGDAGSFNTVVSGAGDACGPWRVRGLDAGQTFVFTCPMNDPGQYVVRAIVDASNTVGELNENNNWLQQQVNVLPLCPPTPTATATTVATATATATATPVVQPTATPTVPACPAGAPLCPGSPVSFRYLGTDWTLTIDGASAQPDENDKRWVNVTITGTLVRSSRHEVERLLAGIGDADIGKMFSLTLVDDHGHPHVAQGATISGPLAVESRLQFEDIRDLPGKISFQVNQFPAPSSMQVATIQVASLPGSKGEGTPLQFQFNLSQGCCIARPAKPSGEPHFKPGVVTDRAIQAMPYLRIELASAKVSDDGMLMTIELALRNDDYVTLNPSLGPALLINGDWSFAAYLGLKEDQPVNYRDAEAIWAQVVSDGIPPLTDKAPQPYVLKVYALAPKGCGPWNKPILYLPKWDRAMPLP